MPAQFFCPITHNLMVDPVFTADGHPYERDVIAAWLATRDTSPLTNEILAHKHLTPNVALRTLISEHATSLPETLPSTQPALPDLFTLAPGCSHAEGCFVSAGPQPALSQPPLPAPSPTHHGRPHSAPTHQHRPQSQRTPPSHRTAREGPEPQEV